MQSKYINHPQNTLFEVSTSDSISLNSDRLNEGEKTFTFKVGFTGHMDMYSDIETVAQYLNAHEGWFCRCAQPMQVDPLGNNGYVLTVGKYGSFGYEVEPKVGVVLSPPVERVYQMQTIDIPDYEAPGYDVNYQATMELNEVVVDHQATVKKGLFSKQQTTPERFTKVSWVLNLEVKVEFPSFMAKLSSAIVQSTGDRLLAQIVRQVSPRLTYKVQQDFHQSHNLAMPPKSSRHLTKVDQLKPCIA